MLARAARLAAIPLRMVGIGPLKAQIKQDYPEIELTGWKEKNELAELCRDVRVLVMPTRSRETFGLSAFEALMSGIPVIVSNRTMIAEEICSDKLGLSGNPENAELFASLLLKVATDDQFVKQASQKAYANRKQLAPDINKYKDDLLMVYGNMLFDTSSPHTGQCPQTRLSRVQS